MRFPDKLAHFAPEQWPTFSGIRNYTNNFKIFRILKLYAHICNYVVIWSLLGEEYANFCPIGGRPKDKSK